MSTPVAESVMAYYLTMITHGIDKVICDRIL